MLEVKSVRVPVMNLNQPFVLGSALNHHLLPPFLTDQGNNMQPSTTSLPCPFDGIVSWCIWTHSLSAPVHGHRLLLVRQWPNTLGEGGASPLNP